MFLLVGLDETPIKFNLKWDPNLAIEFRERFPESILPGWHMNKKHWNTVYVDGQISSNLLVEMIYNFCTLVQAK